MEDNQSVPATANHQTCERGHARSSRSTQITADHRCTLELTQKDELAKTIIVGYINLQSHVIADCRKNNCSLSY